MQTITTVSLAITYPTLPSIIHSLINGYQNLLSIGVETEYTWEGVEDLKDRIANPDKYNVASTVADPETAAEEGETAKTEAPGADKEEFEENEDMGFGLFD